MANCCTFKMIVRGPREACEAFILSTNMSECYEEDYDYEENGDCIYFVSGETKWNLDAYCNKRFKNKFPVPVKIPDPEHIPMADFADKYREYDLQDRTKIFGVDVQVNELDTEWLFCEMEEEKAVQLLQNGVNIWYSHYRNGEVIEDECPDQLLLHDF